MQQEENPSDFSQSARVTHKLPRKTPTENTRKTWRSRTQKEVVIVNLSQVEPQIKHGARQRAGQPECERCSVSGFSISFCCRSNGEHEAQVCPLVFTLFPRGLRFKYKCPPSPTMQYPADNFPSTQHAWSYEFVPMNYVTPLSWWVSGLICSHSIPLHHPFAESKALNAKHCLRKTGFYMSPDTWPRVNMQRLTNSNQFSLCMILTMFDLISLPTFNIYYTLTTLSLIMLWIHK